MIRRIALMSDGKYYPQFRFLWMWWFISFEDCMGGAGYYNYKTIEEARAHWNDDSSDLHLIEIFPVMESSNAR